ncbi:unnamed protein product [Caenorhabditis nigoni]
MGSPDIKEIGCWAGDGETEMRFNWIAVTKLNSEKDYHTGRVDILSVSDLVTTVIMEADAVVKDADVVLDADDAVKDADAVLWKHVKLKFEGKMILQWLHKTNISLPPPPSPPVSVPRIRNRKWRKRNFRGKTKPDKPIEERPSETKRSSSSSDSTRSTSGSSVSSRSTGSSHSSGSTHHQRSATVSSRGSDSRLSSPLALHLESYRSSESPRPSSPMESHRARSSSSPSTGSSCLPSDYSSTSVVSSYTEKRMKKKIRRMIKFKSSSSYASPEASMRYSSALSSSTACNSKMGINSFSSTSSTSSLDSRLSSTSSSCSLVGMKKYWRVLGRTYVVGPVMGIVYPLPCGRKYKQL